MMIKKQYILELKTKKKYVRQNIENVWENDPEDVRKVQEWINLWNYIDPDWKISLLIDGDFGPDTLAAVKEFQKFGKGADVLDDDGIVGKKTWGKLTRPMINAFTRINDVTDFRQLIVGYAKQHLAAQPREFKPNKGPWVRAYMDGKEGASQPWCMGFVQTIVDQASYTIGKTLTDYMPKTTGCDRVGEYGIETGQLITNAEIKAHPDKIKSGDVFLNLKSAGDWTHTGIVIGRNGDWIETIEGNTNDQGSREGYEVCARKRNFKTKTIDIFRIVKGEGD